MAQTLTGVSVRSSVIGTMSMQGTNVQNDIRIGRSLTQSLSATYADILYSVKFTSTATGDVLNWDLDLHKFSAASSDNLTALDRTGHTFTGYSSNGGAPGTPTDAVGDTIPTATSLVALFYETDAANTSTITIASSDNKFGDVILGGGSGTGVTGAHTRSALFMPRADPSNVDITLTFAASGDALTVMVLAKA
tara:strand:- start:4937 stop:5515 length:579 start_codon:yes stop_codon:yes gene_type:complete